MKKFKFRLEPLLKLRAYREKEEQKAHAAACQRVQTQEQVLSSINADRSNNQKQLRDYLHGQLDLARLSVFSRYFVKLKKDELIGAGMLKVLQKEAEDKRLKLLEATRQRKIFEKLKEKHHENHQHEFERAEQKENDEVGIQMNRR